MLLTWREAVQIDWGSLFLLGGGFALSKLVFKTGLAETLATNIEWATPSSDGDQARPAQQVEVSQTKLDDLAVRLERAGANTRATRAAMAEITERIARARQDATRSRATHDIDPIAPDQRGPQR